MSSVDAARSLGLQPSMMSPIAHQPQVVSCILNWGSKMNLSFSSVRRTQVNNKLHVLGLPRGHCPLQAAKRCSVEAWSARVRGAVRYAAGHSNMF